MANEPKKEEPDIAPKRPDIQPDPRPEKPPLDKDGPQKEPPPMQVQLAVTPLTTAKLEWVALL